jgi:cellulose synthase/poly-beta-1,6-N-acetylglucosamine synthase-like glycosyltransferase
MKLLSIAIPCYNSEAYMRNCIESLLPGGDEVEILIVDDGSTKDNTARSRTSTRHAIRASAVPSIRRMAATARP